MQVLVEVPDDISDRLQKMADAEQISVGEMLTRIARQAAFATASNVPALANVAPNEPPRRWRSIMDFEGIGAADAPPRDAQERINELRDEWDIPSDSKSRV